MHALLKDDEENEEQNEELIHLVEAYQIQKSVIDRKVALSKEKGFLLPMERLKTLFGLNQLEIDFLLICLAPHFDAKYGKIYGYLQNDVTKRYATVQLIATLLAQS